MSDVIKLTKKAFSIGVVVTTILWSVGATVLVAGVANAATCPTVKAGDVVKSTNHPALYTVNADSELVYWDEGWQGKTWETATGAAVGTYKEGGYPSILSLDPSCVSNLTQRTATPLAVSIRPGSHPFYRPSTNDLYYVTDNFKVMKIDADAAKMFFGDQTWRTASVKYWPFFTVETGTITKTSLPPMGMLVNDGTKDYLVTDSSGTMKEVTAAGVTANKYNLGYAYKLDATNLAKMTITTGQISAKDTTLTNQTKGAEGGTTTTVAGTLTVALSGNSPSAAKVPISVDNVTIAKFTFTNGGSAAIKVNSVRIARKGLGATSDVSSVTLYDGTTKLGTTKTSWSSNGYMDYTIANGWSIPANSSKELTVKVNIGTAGTYNALGITQLALSAGTASGLPVYGNEMNGVNVTVGGVTITNQANAATFNIGATEADVAKFKLAVNSVEDAKLYGITLKNKAATNNAADGDVKNLYLYVGSTKLAGPVNMSSDEISFTLDTPYAIKKSKNETFTVKGDIANGDANTIEYILNADTDLTVVGDTYGTNLSVTRSAYDAATEGAIITINGAELNISFSSQAKDSADDRTDVSLGELTLSVGSTDVKLTQLVLGIDESPATSGHAVYDIDNLELVDKDDGTTYSGTMTGGGDSDNDNEHWTFSDEIYLYGGKARTFTVRGDIPNNVTTSDAYRVTSTINTTNWVAESVPAGDAIDTFSIGSFTGQFTTVKDAYLTARATVMNNGTATINEEDVVLWEGTVEATAGDVHINHFEFEASSTFSNSWWTDVGVYTRSSAGTYTKLQNLTSSNLVTSTAEYGSVSLDVTEGSANKVTIVVKGKVAGTITGNPTQSLALSYITGKDSDNDTVTVYNSAGSALADDDGATSEQRSRTLTLYSKGVLYVSMRNADAGFNKDRVFLAGKSDWVGKLRVRARYEDIKVKDLKLTNNKAAAYDSIKEVCLYKAKSTDTDNKIGCTTVDSTGVAFFDDINRTISEGTEDWYIYVTLNPMSNEANGTADSKDLVQFSVRTSSGHLTAEGIGSGEQLSGGNNNGTVAAGEIVYDYDQNGTFDEAADGVGTASTTRFYVAGSKISSVSLESTYDGSTVDTLLSGTGQYTMAILKIQTESHSNTDANGNPLKLGFSEIRFDLSKYCSTSFYNGTATATIQRINGSSSSKALSMEYASQAVTSTATSDDWILSTATSSFGNDGLIGPGETVYFEVKAWINALDTTTGVIDWARLSLDDVKGTAGTTDANNNIDWFDGYDTTYNKGNDFEYLLLDTTSITGIKLSEST